MQVFRKKLFFIIMVICVLITHIPDTGFSAEKIIGRIKEIGIGKIVLNKGIMVLIESDTVVENEDGARISYSKLAVKDVIAVVGSGGNKTIRAIKIKKLEH